MVKHQTDNDLFSLKNKVAMVTGAGQNIGAAIAKHLAHYGAKVAIIDKEIDKAQSVANDINNIGGTAIAIETDVTDNNQIKEMIATLDQQWGQLDIAFNNVGICFGGDAEDFDQEQWRQIIQTNLDATFFCCQQAFKAMKANGKGKIINTASVAGVLVPHPQKITAYNTAKAGVIHLTKSLAAEWATYNIQVNSISPGTIHVDAFNTEDMKPWLENWKQQIPANRLASVNDIVGTAIFLASPASDYVTGQNIIVDGGHTLW